MYLLNKGISVFCLDFAVRAASLILQSSLDMRQAETILAVVALREAREGLRQRSEIFPPDVCPKNLAILSDSHIPKAISLCVITVSDLA